MSSLGEFGAEVDLDDAEPDHFTFHGETFELPAAISSLPILRFAWRAKVLAQAEEQSIRAAAMARTTAEVQRAESGRSLAVMENQAAIYEFLSAMLPGQWERFERRAIEVGADEDELMDVAQRIIEAVSARPTRRRPASPGGPSSTGRGSTGDSDSRPVDGPSERLALTAREAARAELAQAMVPVDPRARRSGTRRRSGG